LANKRIVDHDVSANVVISREEMRANGLSGKKVQVPFFFVFGQA